MESLKQYEPLLIPLTELQSKVEQTATCYLPDAIAENGKVWFGVTETPGDPVVAMVAGEGDEGPAVNYLTEWSRFQLLNHLGTKERWFDNVTRTTEAEELSRRLPRLEGFRFRRMNDGPGSTDYTIRGIVSRHYAEIKDVDVVSSLVDLAPDGQCLGASTQDSQRALYVTLLLDKHFGISGTRFEGFPGLVIRNSEVGYTSLWAVPIIWCRSYRRAIVMKTPLLRRAHRGIANLGELLNIALAEASTWWGTMPERMRALAKIRYPDVDTAKASMRALITRNGGSKLMALRCEEAFDRNNSTPTGEGIFSAIMAYVDAETDPDLAYDRSTVAGGVFMALIE